jgi:hypothetical protein
LFANERVLSKIARMPMGGDRTGVGDSMKKCGEFPESPMEEGGKWKPE